MGNRITDLIVSVRSFGKPGGIWDGSFKIDGKSVQFYVNSNPEGRKAEDITFLVAEWEILPKVKKAVSEMILEKIEQAGG